MTAPRARRAASPRAQQVQVRLGPEEYAALRARAEEEGRSMSDALRRAAFGDDSALARTE